MIIFRKARESRAVRKARKPNQTLNDLDEYLRHLGDEPAKILAREVQSWNEISYAELEDLIASGRLNDFMNWQERYAAVVNSHFAPMWAAAIIAAAKKATEGKQVLSDSDVLVQGWIKSRGGELITGLSEESRKAVMNIILRGQALGESPKQIAKEIRPLIGLTTRQAEANVNYREKIFQRYLDAGAKPATAAARADKAALKYASKQHRYRAETIVLTENSFAYNRGAYMGVTQAIADGTMGRCEMVWSTAGTNRVCSRCLALKDTVVGYTDESGVTLPPLHPRCRCVIMYREVEKPRRNLKPRGTMSGALNDKNDPDGKRREAHAENFYEEWRNSKKKFIVRRLAKNSGMSVKAIDKIFDHVFITEHDLDDGRHTFPPDYYMAESFRRLSEGKNIQPHDLILLKHEWLELGLMKRYNYDYNTAHDITERKYNYTLALREWHKREGIAWSG